MNTIPLIMERPFFGWGAGTFAILFNERYAEFSRILLIRITVLEMSYSYGTIFATIITLTILLLLLKSFKIIFLKKTDPKEVNNFQNHNTNKAWWSSFFALFLSQMYDIQYFDFRISLSFWILLSGLICIIKNDNFKEISNLENRKKLK